MLLRFLRYLRGYVRFSVNGKFPERFLNITSSRGVRLWEVQRRGESFSASMYMSDYRRIRPLTRKANVRLKLSKKCGLPAFLSRNRRRVGPVIGACAFLLTVFIMSQFIWTVDISGLDTVSESEMRDLLRENGMYVGAFKPALDMQEISRAIMLEKHEVGWMAVNVTGSYASVEVKEEAPAPEVNDISFPCNVKAKRDGVLLRIEAYEGRAAIAEGSGVIAGQLIISGVIEDELHGARLVHAGGRVIAETTHEARFALPATLSGLSPDGETAERLSLNLFGLRLPFGFGKVSSPYSASLEVTESPAPLGVTLPVGTVTEHVSALCESERKLDENSAEELLRQQSVLYETFVLADCTVTARDYSLSCEDDTYTLTVVYTCTEDIAVSEPIGTDENTV